MKFFNKNHGITLISLIITIIILLILAGITIQQFTGSGLFRKAELSNEKTRYTSAKEIVDLKLMEIQLECVEKNEKYNIKIIAEKMKEADNITIEKYYNKKTSSIKENISENTTDLEGLVVSVDIYAEYKFLIGESCKIIGATIEKIPELIVNFKKVEEFEKENFNISEKEEKRDTNYLFKQGDEKISTTGGWNLIYQTYSKIVNENGSFFATRWAGSYGGWAIITKNKVNISGKTKLCCKYSIKTNYHGGVSGRVILDNTEISNENLMNARTQYKSELMLYDTIEEILKWDISNVPEGDYYVGISSNCSNETNIYEIWFE